MLSPKMLPISEGDSGDDAKMLFSETFITNDLHGIKTTLYEETQTLMTGLKGKRKNVRKVLEYLK